MCVSPTTRALTVCFAAARRHLSGDGLPRTVVGGEVRHFYLSGRSLWRAHGADHAQDVQQLVVEYITAANADGTTPLPS